MATSSVEATMPSGIEKSQGERYRMRIEGPQMDCPTPKVTSRPKLTRQDHSNVRRGAAGEHHTNSKSKRPVNNGGRRTAPVRSPASSPSVLESWVSNRRPVPLANLSKSPSSPSVKRADPVLERQSSEPRQRGSSCDYKKSARISSVNNERNRVSNEKQSKHQEYTQQPLSVEDAAIQFATNGIEIVKKNPGRAATVICGGIVGGVAGFVVAGPAGAIIGAKVGQITSGTGVLLESGVGKETTTNSVGRSLGKKPVDSSDQMLLNSCNVQSFMYFRQTDPFPLDCQETKENTGDGYRPRRQGRNEKLPIRNNFGSSAHRNASENTARRNHMNNGTRDRRAQ